MAQLNASIGRFVITEEQYINNMKCTWKIRVESGKVSHTTLSKLILYKSGDLLNYLFLKNSENGN